MSAIDTMEAYLRDTALDMLEMMREVNVTTTTVSATIDNSIHIGAYNRGRLVFQLDARVEDGELVPYE